MANQIQPLFEPVQLAAAVALIFTATARTRIDKLTVANPSASTTYNATFHWVPGAGAPGASNIIQPLRAILPLEAYDIFPFIGHTLAAGDSIYGFASTAAVLNLFGSGLVMS